MTWDEAESTVNTYICTAKRECERDRQQALYRIARLRWWQLWTARRIAQEALGIGPYWKKGPKKG